MTFDCNENLLVNCEDKADAADNVNYLPFPLSANCS